MGKACIIHHVSDVRWTQGGRKGGGGGGGGGGGAQSFQQVLKQFIIQSVRFEHSAAS